MDLSKKQKTRRDAVEAPLFRVEQLLDHLDEVHTRMEAAVKVWSETTRTLSPAIHRLDHARKDLRKLQEELSELWKQGFEAKWK